MNSTTASMTSSMTNAAIQDDAYGTSWETVLRIFRTPTPDEYTFEPEFDPTRPLATDGDEEGQTSEENLVVDEYLFKQSQRYPLQVHNKGAEQKLKAIQAPPLTVVEVPIVRGPETFLKLTEVEMVQSLRRKKHLFNGESMHPVTIKEADVYTMHPADLIAGARTHYFYSSTKYSCLKRPTRLRITDNGCRWKQQGRIFPIKNGGQTIAYKTYLSYVALKNGSAPLNRQPPPPEVDDSMGGLTRDRKWSPWTMEEIGLAEDIQAERVTLRRGAKPRPFNVLCRIVCKKDRNNLANAFQPKAKAKKAIKKSTQKIKTPGHGPADLKMCDVDMTLIEDTPSPFLGFAHVKTMKTEGGALGAPAATSSSGEASSSLGNYSHGPAMGAQDPGLEDDIIRALIYELPYRRVIFG